MLLILYKKPSHIFVREGSDKGNRKTKKLLLSLIIQQNGNRF